MSDKYIILTSFMVDHALLFDRVTGKVYQDNRKVGQRAWRTALAMLCRNTK